MLLPGRCPSQERRRPSLRVIHVTKPEDSEIQVFVVLIDGNDSTFFPSRHRARNRKSHKGQTNGPITALINCVTVIGFTLVHNDRLSEPKLCLLQSIVFKHLSPPVKPPVDTAERGQGQSQPFSASQCRWCR